MVCPASCFTQLAQGVNHPDTTALIIIDNGLIQLPKGAAALPVAAQPGTARPRHPPRNWRISKAILAIPRLKSARCLVDLAILDIESATVESAFQSKRQPS